MLTGQKIVNLRLQANITQEQLAEKLYVTRELVFKWERGKSQPDYNTILKIAEILSVDPDDILSRNDAILSELSCCLPDSCDEDTGILIASINDFLRTLNERNRSIFIRRYYYMEEMSVIAENYGIKESYVRTVLARTRKKLTKYFKEMYL